MAKQDQFADLFSKAKAHGKETVSDTDNDTTTPASDTDTTPTEPPTPDPAAAKTATATTPKSRKKTSSSKGSKDKTKKATATAKQSSPTEASSMNANAFPDKTVKEQPRVTIRPRYQGKSSDPDWTNKHLFFRRDKLARIDNAGLNADLSDIVDAALDLLLEELGV